MHNFVALLMRIPQVVVRARAKYQDPHAKNFALEHFQEKWEPVFRPKMRLTLRV
jgi:hypothetical protein